MALGQIPMNFYPEPNKTKSYWASILIFIIVILFGLFYFYQKDQSETLPVVIAPVNIQKKQTSSDITNSLEESVESIEIPNHSESL